jgi:hypothetical protein
MTTREFTWSEIEEMVYNCVDKETESWKYGHLDTYVALFDEMYWEF